MNVLASSNIADIAVAAIAAVPAVATVLVANRKQNQKLDKVNKSVATSNGKTSGQYVEELWHKFDSVEAGQQALAKQIAEHTVLDAVNFAAIDKRLRNINQQLEGDDDS